MLSIYSSLVARCLHLDLFAFAPFRHRFVRVARRARDHVARRARALLIIHLCKRTHIDEQTCPGHTHLYNRTITAKILWSGNKRKEEALKKNRYSRAERCGYTIESGKEIIRGDSGYTRRQHHYALNSECIYVFAYREQARWRLSPVQRILI